MTKVFAKALTDFRWNNRLKQQQIADASGVPQSLLSEWMSGKKRPSPERLRPLLEAYPKQSEWLLAAFLTDVRNIAIGRDPEAKRRKEAKL